MHFKRWGLEQARPQRLKCTRSSAQRLKRAVQIGPFLEMWGVPTTFASQFLGWPLAHLMRGYKAPVVSCSYLALRFLGFGSLYLFLLGNVWSGDFSLGLGHALDFRFLTQIYENLPNPRIFAASGGVSCWILPYALCEFPRSGQICWIWRFWNWSKLIKTNVNNWFQNLQFAWNLNISEICWIQRF